jgi:hypothetical protein
MKPPRAITGAHEGVARAEILERRDALRAR